MSMTKTKRCSSTDERNDAEAPEAAAAVVEDAETPEDTAAIDALAAGEIAEHWHEQRNWPRLAVGCPLVGRWDQRARGRWPEMRPEATVRGCR